MARLATTYRSNRRQVGAVVMLPRVIGENVDRLGHRYDIRRSRIYGAGAPPMNGARECARRRKQMGRNVGILTGLVVLDIDGDRHVNRTEEPRPLAVEPETSDVASVEIGLRRNAFRAQPDQRSRNRKPLTQEQKDRKNEQERARRAAAKVRETVA